MLCKPSQNQIIDIMQWDLHSGNTTHDPPLERSLSTSITSFSTTPHPTDKTAPDIPVELTTGFRLLGQPVGSATFASDFFAHRINDIKKYITSLIDNITNQLTRLRNSSPSASYKHYPISSLRTFSLIYQLTILTHPGKNGMAYLPPASTLSSKRSSAHSSPPRT